ncbi:hypothetical protein ASE28_06415 [Acidovorax sp. Root219]|nr:hypothetical protein ASE28_06415 [Acidovorax sp. Root219]
MLAVRCLSIVTSSMKQSLEFLVRGLGKQRLLPAAGLLLLSGAVLFTLLRSYGVAALAGTLALVSLSVSVLPPEYRTRVMLAFTLAPLAPAVAVMIRSGEVQASVVVALYAYYFSMLSVPVYLLVLRRRRWLGIGQVACAGAVMGTVAGFFVFSFDARVYERLLLIAYGALAGTVFWLIAFFGAKKSKESISA